MRRSMLSRRDWLRLSSTGLAAASMSGWIEALADQTAPDPGRRRSCILLWMTGGPSQIDTFDLKPGHANGGQFKEIETTVPGMRIGEHLPKLAMQASELAIVRSMSTKEGDHTRATYFLRTGYLPQGPVQYPTFGSLVSNERNDTATDLPNFVSIAPYRFFSPGAYEPGFLGPRHAPFVVGNAFMPFSPQPGGVDVAQLLKVENLDRPGGVERPQFDTRLGLLAGLEEDFQTRHPGSPVASHRTAYDQAVRMMNSAARQAFEIEREPGPLRDAYGRNPFGQGCLLARRLIERGVPFVEVSLNGVGQSQVFGWDTHVGNFDAVRQLCEVLDPGWATLIADLKSRGLLDSTLVVWMGEFGRTPGINNSGGRDHFPSAWSTVLAGGGLQGGSVVGRTSKSGMKVEERPVGVSDLLATICHQLGIDPMGQNMSNVGRPIRVVDPEAKAIEELLG